MTRDFGEAGLRGDIVQQRSAKGRWDAGQQIGARRGGRMAAQIGLAAASKVIADRRGGDAGFAHGMTDLVEPDDDVAGGVQARDGGALMAVDLDAAVPAQLGGQVPGERGMHDRPHGGIDFGLELHAPTERGVKAKAGGPPVGNRRPDHRRPDACLGKDAALAGRERVRAMGDTSVTYRPGVGPEKQRSPHPVFGGADAGHILIADFIAVAHRA